MSGRPGREGLSAYLSFTGRASAERITSAKASERGAEAVMVGPRRPDGRRLALISGRRGTPWRTFYLQRSADSTNSSAAYGGGNASALARYGGVRACRGLHLYSLCEQLCILGASSCLRLPRGFPQTRLAFPLGLGLILVIRALGLRTVVMRQTGVRTLRITRAVPPRGHDECHHSGTLGFTTTSSWPDTA